MDADTHEETNIFALFNSENAIRKFYHIWSFEVAIEVFLSEIKREVLDHNAKILKSLM